MIEVNDLEKTFKLYHRPADRLLEIVMRRPYHTPYHALKHISLYCIGLTIYFEK